MANTNTAIRATFDEARDVVHKNAVANMHANLNSISLLVGADDVLCKIGWTWDEYKDELQRRKDAILGGK